MSKLITAKDVIECSESGQSVCYVEGKTIITPAAIDEAQRRNIEFKECCSQGDSPNPESDKSITGEEILCLLKKMLSTDDAKEDGLPLPYRCVKHVNGLKVVKGSEELGILR